MVAQASRLGWIVYGGVGQFTAETHDCPAHIDTAKSPRRPDEACIRICRHLNST